MFLKQTSYKPKSRTSSQSSLPPPTPDAATNATTPADPPAASKPRTASQTWEDRRFMFPTGRKSSISSAAAAVVGGDDAAPATVTPQKASPFAMSKPNTSENPHPTLLGFAGVTGDRHGIWGKGREVHEGVGERRKSSASSPTMKSGMLANILGTGK